MAIEETLEDLKEIELQRRDIGLTVEQIETRLKSGEKLELGYLLISEENLETLKSKIFLDSKIKMDETAKKIEDLGLEAKTEFLERKVLGDEQTDVGQLAGIISNNIRTTDNDKKMKTADLVLLVQMIDYLETEMKVFEAEKAKAAASAKVRQERVFPSTVEIDKALEEFIGQRTQERDTKATRLEDKKKIKKTLEETRETVGLLLEELLEDSSQEAEKLWTDY